MVYSAMDKAEQQAGVVDRQTLSLVWIAIANNVRNGGEHEGEPETSSRSLQLWLQCGPLEDNAIRTAAARRHL